MAPKRSTQQWEELFKKFDKDNSGTLDVHELRNLLRAGNSNMTDTQIADAFVYFDGPQGDRRITLDEFVKGLKKLEDFISKLAQLFKQYDSDNSGFLDKNELRKILEASGHKFTDPEVNEILKNADKSGDGKISFEEFMDACT
ncbi:neo-calmodulin-like isoform X2 [Physella acuta]|nr:neo-calmodulin-like isoform X2 [Physella acuta]